MLSLVSATLHPFLKSYNWPQLYRVGANCEARHTPAAETLDKFSLPG